MNKNNQLQQKRLRVIIPIDMNYQELIDYWSKDFDTTVLERPTDLLIILDRKEENDVGDTGIEKE